jgi:hypothetical protein
MSTSAPADRSRTAFLVVASAAVVLAGWLSLTADATSHGLSTKPGVDGNLQTIFSVQRDGDGKVVGVGSAGPTVTIKPGDPGWTPPPAGAPTAP